jgi:hypothetical protein
MDLETYLADFHAVMGKPTQYAAFSAADRQRLEGRLPGAVLDLFALDGFAHYKRQSLWTCDPDTMSEVKVTWLKDFPKGEIFMRTAFGDFFFWDGTDCWICLVHLGAIMFGGNVTWVLGSMLSSAALRKSLGIPGFTDKGRKACGPLERDQVYIWVPEIALGGTSMTSAIEIGGMAVALEILTQIQPISIQPINR